MNIIRCVNNSLRFYKNNTQHASSLPKNIDIFLKQLPYLPPISQSSTQLYFSSSIIFAISCCFEEDSCQPLLVNKFSLLIHSSYSNILWINIYAFIVKFWLHGVSKTYILHYSIPVNIKSIL